jgi:acyl transferase domain-containing protein/acyl carrier protein
MEPIAVVGLGCVLPGALNPADYWRNLLERRVSLCDVPTRSWNHALYFSADRSAPDKTYVRRGGFVQGFAVDWKRFKIPPADVEAVNPLQWMVLEAGCQALSGVHNLPRETSAVIIGSTGLGWQRDSGLRIRLEDMIDAVRQSEPLQRLSASERDGLLELAHRNLTARLQEVSEDNVVGASASVAAGRINMQFDFKGPHYAVDAGFASSLAAVDLAVRGLRDREFDLAVTGGVSELLSPLELVAFAKLGALASGEVRPFDQAADGTLLGEGAALFSLRRLDDALAAGDTVYAVLRGVGGSSDGRGKSLVAPRSEGQALAMQRALEDVGEQVDPSTLGYIECHATGTQLGDASEVRALTRTYGSAARQSIALGSVKANIGHLRAGAGAASLLKTVLSLHHRKIPATPNFSTPSAQLELESTPFFVARAESDYPANRLPRAAVSAFSFGGNNFHAVLEAFQPATAPRLAASGRRAFDTEPLAIIGMGGQFPGAKDVPEFWQKMLEGYDRTQSVPADRYPIANYFEAATTRKDKSYTSLGCFLDALPDPEPSMRIPPAAWQAIDPSHVLCLKSAEEALRDAAYQPGKWNPDRVSVSLAFLPYQGKKFLADTRLNWNEFRCELDLVLRERGIADRPREELLSSAEERYKRALPHITEDTLTGYMGSLNAGRISWLYDFHGPHFVVDAACASTHAALHAGWKLLSHRLADVVLTGGVWCDMRPEFFIAACRFNALSARGSFPFNASADGFIPGEGAGVIVLKRLADAERDGDPIRAVVRALQGSSDGKGRSVLAPSRAGEALAMTRALRQSGISAASVDYVECHGTGTALGDVVEASAVGDAFGAEGRSTPIGIGSVKSNIGHLNAAAGVAGMIKATLAVEKGLIPASIKCATPNPKIPPSVQVVTQQRRWASGPEGGPRRAGVSAFGVGGANYHALIEEYRPRSAAVSHLLAFGASDLAGALEQLEAHLAAVVAGSQTLGQRVGEPTGPVRVALTAKSTADATRKLGLIRNAGGKTDFLEQLGIFIGEPTSVLRRSPVALMFPGQGGQYANMLRPLAEAHPAVRATLEEADAIYQRLAGRSLTGSFFTDAPEKFVQRDEDAHAAVLTVNVALARLLESFGIVPKLLIGQSAGELAGLVVARALSLEQALSAVRSRTLSVLGLTSKDPGVMAALGCSSDEVPALLAGLQGYAALAADNGPKACIVSADRPALEGLVSACAARGIECTVLAVSHGYHCELISAAQQPYREALEALDFSPLRIPLISTIDAQPYAGRPVQAIPAFLATQFVKPVLLRQALLLAHREGARVFLEAGPKWSLTQFTRETLGALPHGAMASIHPKVGELEQFNRLVAFCFVHEIGALAPAPPRIGDRMSRLSVVPPTSPPPTPAAEEALLTLPLAEVLDTNTARSVAAALGARCGVDTRGAAPADLSSFEAIIALVERLVAAPLPPVAQNESRTNVDPKTLEAEVRGVLLANMVAKTGYPAEMLGEELDLEADLGIDTVKQVEIFSKTREHFDVPRDPNLALRDFNTIRKVIEHIRDRVIAVRGAARPASKAPVKAAPAPAPAPAPARLSPAAIQAALIARAVEKTGYPEEMLGLDLDLEADLGIDTVKQVEIFSKTREQFGIARDSGFVLRDYNTLRKFIAYLAGQQTPVAPPPSAVASEPAVPQTVRGTLLSMSLDELGLAEPAKQKLARALAARLGVAVPSLGTVATLEDLVRAVDSSGRKK